MSHEGALRVQAVTGLDCVLPSGLWIVMIVIALGQVWNPNKTVKATRHATARSCSVTIGEIYCLYHSIHHCYSIAPARKI